MSGIREHTRRLFEHTSFGTIPLVRSKRSALGLCVAEKSLLVVCDAELERFSAGKSSVFGFPYVGVLPS